MSGCSLGVLWCHPGSSSFRVKLCTLNYKNKIESVTSWLLLVEHEEPGVRAALSGLQGHHQTAHSPAMPAQRLPHVCLGGLGCEWLSASRASCGAEFARLHAEHPLPPPSPQAYTQSWAAAYWACVTGRSGFPLYISWKCFPNDLQARQWHICVILFFPSSHLFFVFPWLEVPIHLHPPCPGLQDMGRIRGDGVRRAHPWWWCSHVSHVVEMWSWERRASLTVCAISRWSE